MSHYSKLIEPAEGVIGAYSLYSWLVRSTGAAQTFDQCLTEGSGGSLVGWSP